MVNVRRGINIRVGFSVYRNGIPEDLAQVQNLRVVIRHKSLPNSSAAFTGSAVKVLGNSVSVVVSDIMQRTMAAGQYYIEVAYRLVSPTAPDGYDPYIVDADVFELVERSLDPNDIAIQTVNIPGEVSFSSQALDEILVEASGAVQAANAAAQAANDAADAAMTIVDSKVDIDGLNANVKRLQFDTTNPTAPTAAGQIAWDNDEQTLVLNDGLHTRPLGKELELRAMNTSGATILKGQACYVTGSTGDNPTIALATNTDGDVAQKTIGVATMDIANNAFGIVTTFGEVNDIDTSALTLGAIVYLGANGLLTTTEPVAPTPKIVIGVCVRQHAQVGKLFVSTRPIARLSKLSEVHAATLTDNDVLRYNGTTLRWEVYSLANKADLVGGKIPSTQLPAYVDDVLEYANLAAFPATGEAGKIYVALNTNLTYRWSGTAYVEISKSLALGETADTAYRGDRGKTAYDHSQTTGNPHNTTAAQIPNTPAGTVAATTVQGAINELASDIVQVETNLNQKLNKSISIESEEGYFTINVAQTNKIIRINSFTDISLFIPNDNEDTFENGSFVDIYQEGNGKIFVFPKNGVVLAPSIPEDTFVPATTGQYSILRLIKVGTNDWVATGSVNMINGIGKNPPVNNLIANAISDTQINLSWNYDSEMIEGFAIERSSDGVVFIELAKVLKDIASYSDNGLTAYTGYYYRVRAYNGNVYCEAGNIVRVATSTDFGFCTNQQSSNVNLVIDNLIVSAGKSVTIDWGDGTSGNYSGTNTNITHKYGSLGNFIVKFSGDVDFITRFGHKNQSRSYGDISNWKIPDSMTFFDLNAISNFTGNIDNWEFPNSCGLISLYNCRKLTGNPLKKNIPTSLYKLDVTLTNLRGDLSTVNLTTNMTYVSVKSANYFKFPRGNFKNISTFDFSKNNCSSSEIDAFLAYLDFQFTELNKPSSNAVYTINSDGMGAPTNGVNNANLVSIISKYQANGKTCSILVNDYQVAYSDNNTKKMLSIPTYEESGQTCHPSVLNVGYRWNGYRYWMANTPFPGGAASYENPSIWASNDGINWVVPDGIMNPIINKPIGATSFNADSEIYFENGVLYLIWKESLNNVPTTKISSTTDLITWSTPKIIANPSDLEGDVYEQASPSLIKINDVYYLYYISKDVGNFHIRRRSCLTVDGYYTNAEDISLTKPSGRGFWHFSVRNFNGVILLTTNVTQLDNTNTYGPYIIIAKSTDGVNFIRDIDALPTVAITESWERESSYYRPCLVYVGNQLVCYYSHLINSDATIWKTSRINVFIK